MDELHGVADELAASRGALAEAKEETLRLMEEVKALRATLKERDEEVRRAAQSQVALVERWADEEAQSLARRTRESPGANKQ